MLKEQLEEFIYGLGLDTFGMIPVRSLDELKPMLQRRQEKGLQNEFESNDLEQRMNPAHYMEDGKTILSIAFPYYHEDDSKPNGFSVYTKRADYHKVVKGYLGQICQFIEQSGGRAEGYVDSNTLPERYLAYLAGVGFIGRNNMIITKKYGSYVFLGEIITNLEFSCKDQRSYDEIREFKECGECRLCYQECPTKSINAGSVNPNLCLSYYTQKKELSDQQVKMLKGNLFGCDYCQLKCPYNQQAVKNVLKEFETCEFMKEEAEIYADMDNKQFKEQIGKTSCGWRGKNVIRRNAILSLAREGKDIERYKGDSPYINYYVDHAKKIFGKQAEISSDSNNSK